MSNKFYPKSPCCNAPMYGVNKNEDGITSIDYIYCGKCCRHLDGNGKRIEPPRLHGDRSIDLAKEYREFTYEFKEYGELSFWKVVWLVDDQPMRQVRILHCDNEFDDWILRQSLATSMAPTKWDSIDFIKSTDFYKKKHSKL